MKPTRGEQYEWWKEATRFAFAQWGERVKVVNYYGKCCQGVRKLGYIYEARLDFGPKHLANMAYILRTWDGTLSIYDNSQENAGK